MKLLSIVIPVYNTSQWLPLCLESVLKCSSEDYEIIVVDDGSTDDSRELVECYASTHGNIRLVLMGVNSGLCAVRNRGIAESSGKFVVFVDSDDYLSPKAVEEILSLLLILDADIIRFRLRRIKENGDIISVPGHKLTNRYEIDPSSENDPKLLRKVFDIFGLSSMGGNTIFKRSILKGISYDAKFTPSEDRVFGTAVFLKATTFYVTDCIWYNYVQHPVGLSKNYSQEQITSLLYIQWYLLERLREWPWFNLIKRTAFSRILNVYLGWDYELVFSRQPRIPALTRFYFETLEKILVLGNQVGLSSVKLRILSFFARQNIVMGLAGFRIPATLRVFVTRRLQQTCRFFLRKK